MPEVVKVRLGIAEGGLPLDILVGAPHCERISVVGAPALAALISDAAGPQAVVATSSTLDAARCPVHICGPQATPQDYARALRLPQSQVTDLPADLYWLSAQGNLFGFRPNAVPAQAD